MRGSAAKRTPQPVWSDGLHYVRPASADSKRSQPWVMGAHRTTGTALTRWYDTLDEALSAAQRATKGHLKAHPEAKKLVKASLLPAASSLQGEKRRRGRPPKPKVVLEPFKPSNYFVCIHANPYAQVWQCRRYIGEVGARGRRKDGNKPATPTPFRHTLMQCSVTIGEEPVRDEHGKVLILSRYEAEELADELYANAPEDEVITWSPPPPGQRRSKVWSTRYHDVYFDPFGADATEEKPFYIMNVPFKKPIYVDKTRSLHGDEQSAKALARLQTTNPALYVEALQARKKRMAEDRVPTFSQNVLLFQTMTAAVAEAERRDRMMMGQTV